MPTIELTEASQASKKRKKRLENHRAFAERHGVSGRTIDRWHKQGRLPDPEYINGRKYWNSDTEPRRDADAV